MNFAKAFTKANVCCRNRLAPFYSSGFCCASVEAFQSRREVGKRMVADSLKINLVSRLYVIASRIVFRRSFPQLLKKNLQAGFRSCLRKIAIKPRLNLSMAKNKTTGWIQFITNENSFLILKGSIPGFNAINMIKLYGGIHFFPSFPVTGYVFLPAMPDLLHQNLNTTAI